MRQRSPKAVEAYVPANTSSERMTGQAECGFIQAAQALAAVAVSVTALALCQGRDLLGHRTIQVIIPDVPENAPP